MAAEVADHSFSFRSPTNAAQEITPSTICLVMMCCFWASQSLHKAVEREMPGKVTAKVESKKLKHWHSIPRLIMVLPHVCFCYALARTCHGSLDTFCCWISRFNTLGWFGIILVCETSSIWQSARTCRLSISSCCSASADVMIKTRWFSLSTFSPR